MRFKNQNRSSSMPEVNLVPMMDVIMTILTFFIIVSMTLTNYQAVDVALPSAERGTSNERPKEPLIVGVDRQGQMVLNNATVNETQLAQQIVTYFQQNPNGSVVLKADKQLPYEKVVQVLGVLRDIGGDRVSLAIE